MLRGGGARGLRVVGGQHDAGHGHAPEHLKIGHQLDAGGRAFGSGIEMEVDQRKVWDLATFAPMALGFAVIARGDDAAAPFAEQRGQTFEHGRFVVETEYETAIDAIGAASRHEGFGGGDRVGVADRYRDREHAAVARPGMQ